MKNERVKYLIELWDKDVENAIGKSSTTQEALDLSSKLISNMRVMIEEQQKQIDNLEERVIELLKAEQ